MDNLFRKICKRRAKKLLVQLITVDKRKDKSTARSQRSEAATRLVEIAEKERGGEEIVARRFVKTKSRREEGTRVLLALSDDEIDEIGLGPIDTVLPQPASVKLLRIVMKHTNDATFFKKTISTALESGAQGGLAILHLATQNPLSFFGNIDHKLILGFSERVIGTNGLLSPRWFYAVKLLSILLDRVPPCAWRASELVPSLLSNLFRGIIEQRNPGSQGDGWDVYIRSLRLLALATQCCNAIKTDFDSTILPPTETLQPFIQCLIDLILPADDDGVRDLNAERGWAFSTLLSLLKFPGIVELIPSNKLSRLGALLMDMTLYSWTLDKDASEEVGGNLYNSSLST